MFEHRLVELDLSATKARTLLGVERLTLNGILDGTQKNFNLLAISRLANFLQVPNTELINLLLEQLGKNFPDEFYEYKKREFILNNFDLANLMKSGFIDSISDFAHIEETIVKYFGFNSIYDYGKIAIKPAYSSGARKPKNNLTKDFWIESAAYTLSLIDNPHVYDRANLLKYIPSIRWHTINIKKGLSQVIRELYTLGVTVIFEDYINQLWVRGATFAINDKPCIALTNYTKYYPSLWFALMHELHHVLFDWEEVRNNTYHISSELDTFTMKEVQADEFALEFLFPNEKMQKVAPHIGNETLISEYAKAYQIDKSLIYANYCWQHKDTDENAFARFSKLIPDFTAAVDSIPWESRKAGNPIKDIVKLRKEKIFNGL